jgi:hypothetical protein
MRNNFYDFTDDTIYPSWGLVKNQAVVSIGNAYYLFAEVVKMATYHMLSHSLLFSRWFLFECTLGGLP